MEKTVWTSKKIEHLYCGKYCVEAEIDGIYVMAGNAGTLVYIMGVDGNLLGITRNGMIFCSGMTVTCGIDWSGCMCFEVGR